MRFLLCLIWCLSAYCCTDFVILAKDGSAVNGRSLEFGVELNSKIKLFPRNQKIVSQSPDKKKSIEWVSKYGFLGITALGQGFAFDGLNEAGVSFGYLWLPGYTQYPTVPPKEMKKALDFLDLGAWILGNFSNVADVREALKDVRIWGHAVPGLGIAPVHAAVHDSKGNNLVIEFVNGEMRVHDNPMSVLTNSPPFEWQINNLQNYLTLDANNAAPFSFRGQTIEFFGQGSGLRGIPGDWTAPSRFVKMITFLRMLKTPADSLEGVNLAEHLLNTVDIPLGLIRERGKDALDYTQWIVVKDMSQKAFYFRSYKDLCMKKIELNKLDFSQEANYTLPIDLSKGYVDVTPLLKTKEGMTVLN